MIFTLTLNPALDISATTDTVVAGPKLRLSQPVYDPGGGGVNVSRAIRALGGESTALVPLGGASGDQMERMLRAEGVRFERLFAVGDTRQSLSVTESTTGQQFRFVMPGASWTETEEHDLTGRVLRSVHKGSWTVLSGSNPPGVSDGLATALSAVLGQERPLLVDTSGAPLRAIAKGSRTPPAVLRMDQLEAEDLAGQPLEDLASTLEFAQSLLDRSVARTIVVSRGAEGSVLLNRKERLFAPAAKVPVVSKVGAGDSFVAGFVMELSLGGNYRTALQRGVAAASAAVTTPATDLCQGADVDRLMPACETRVLD